jgi:hypothetical protein
MQSKGELRMSPVITGWWRSDGLRRPHVYLGLPLIAGAVSWSCDWQLHNVATLQAGSVFLAGAMLTILFQVYGWSQSAADTVALNDDRSLGGAVERILARNRLDVITDLYRTLTWATLVSFLMATVLVALSAAGMTNPTTSHPRTSLVSATAVLCTVAVHLALLVIVILNRVFNSTHAAIERPTSTRSSRQ